MTTVRGKMEFLPIRLCRIRGSMPVKKPCDHFADKGFVDSKKRREKRRLVVFVYIWHSYSNAGTSGS